MRRWELLFCGLAIAFGPIAARAVSFSESALYFVEEAGKVGLVPLYWRLDRRTSAGSSLALFIPTRLDASAWPRYGNDYWDDDWMGTLKETLRVQYAPEPWLRLSAKSVLSLNAYRRGGYHNEWGPRASRLMKGNMTLAGEVLLAGDRLSLYLPATVQVSRYANFVEGARYNRRLRSALWLTPEITYYGPGEVTFSVNYETDTFIASDWSESYFWESLVAGSVNFWVSVPL